ncbi:hypothetical protein ABZP36_023859 [Zizania latifolia]
MAAAHLVLLLLVAGSHGFPAAAAASEAHPGYAGKETCEGPAEVRMGIEEYGGGRIVDITHAYRPDLPAFAPGAVTGPVVRLKESMANGSLYNLSELRMECHRGTHVDAPGHINQDHFAAGLDVDTLDLELLNGTPPSLAGPTKAMESLRIPKGVRRVLFRTLNTDRKLMWKKGGDLSYVGFTEDGAQWLVDNTDIKLIGVDYLSVAAYSDLISAHVVFFRIPNIILVEGLKLDDVKPGIYMLHCLPLRLVGSEGSPISEKNATCCSYLSLAIVMHPDPTQFQALGVAQTWRLGAADHRPPAPPPAPADNN